MTQAQEQRAAQAEAKQMPADGARLLPFPALMRAEAVDWNGMSRYQLDGIASTTEQPYRMFDMFGEYEEVIDRAAFNETLSADPDVAFLVNHKGVTMARSRPNSRGFRSLDLSVGATGLQSRAFLNPERQDVKDLVHAVRDADITEMSFAFRIDDGSWNDDYSEFRIRKVDLNRGDVSAVNYGANPYTSIAARSAELLRDLDRLPVGAARAALERLQARRELQPVVIDLGARAAADESSATPRRAAASRAPSSLPRRCSPPSRGSRTTSAPIWAARYTWPAWSGR
jgi:HK97 family phage prohead protease